MKTIFRHFIIDTFSLFTASQIAQGMQFDLGFKTLFLAGIAVTLVSIVAKPVINLLLLPLNLITFGLFHWVASGIVLYLVTLLVKNFKIVFFSYGGFSNKWIDLPSLYFEGVLAFVAFSFVVSIISSFIYWLIK